ncbi:C-type lectin domain family 2 member F-like isoform X3 [Mauremys mutica]|uniref:C-type lectin domain family 2 member F-like isoform X3 n=1 Tax=Mauremys mutica TaxID=74926 RepID=UPI001D15FDB3|nr:C-type lectin domain family 2 member F-like isoform X3 [Mauremys mutica]
MAAIEPETVKRLLDEFICSICQDYLTDPVITNCGHNFCRVCINRYWDKCEPVCPECREACSERELVPNVQLRSAVRKAKGLYSAAPGAPATGDGVCQSHKGAVCTESQAHKDHTVLRAEDAAQDHKATKRPKTQSTCEEEKENFLKPSQTKAYKPDLQLGNYRIPKERVYQGCIVVLAVAIPASFFIGVGRSNSLLAAKGPNCPDGWVGFLGKCYYFSETEGNWTYSQKNCSALGASLAVIDTFQDLVFMLRYKGILDHWIGLWRNQDGQPWKWPNGTEFNNLFEIQGEGDCVYLNNNYARIVGCGLERHWICSKWDGYTARKQNAPHRNSNF